MTFPDNLIPDWARTLPIAITVTDEQACIIYMNHKSETTFSNYGDLIGKSLMDCHNPNSAEIIRRLLREGGTNLYTIEKNGVKKLIWQGAWHRNEHVAGLVEISIVLPPDMPHFIRS